MGKNKKSTQKNKKSTAWGIVFSYLLVTKIIYWHNAIINAHHFGGLMVVVDTLLIRLLTQDLLIILILLFTFNIEKIVPLKYSKGSKILHQIIIHSIEYVVFVVVHIAYYLALFSIFGVDTSYIDWGNGLIQITGLFLVVVVVTEIKTWFKKKEKTEYTRALSTDEKLAMFKILLDNDALTQEEYDRKKEGLLVTEVICDIENTAVGGGDND